MKAQEFFSELKRRRVWSVAVTYAVVGWLLIQIVTQVFPPFEISNWAERLVIVAIVLGFPIALVLAWVYDFTPHGVKRTEDLEPDRRPNIVQATALRFGRKRSTARCRAFLPCRTKSRARLSMR